MMTDVIESLMTIAGVCVATWVVCIVVDKTWQSVKRSVIRQENRRNLERICRRGRRRVPADWEEP